MAVIENGVPSWVRGDRSGENRDVLILMILLRGINRASFMWGSSVFNTRIERLWVEVGKQFGRQWHTFFLRLERDHQLDHTDPAHLWLLHLLFLDDINRDVDNLKDTWNAHPISGIGHNKSPNAMVLLGALEHGVYDDCEGYTLDEIIDYYGYDEFDQADSGEYESSRDRELPAYSNEDLDEVIRDENRNIHHEPVKVPWHRCPFNGEKLDDLMSQAALLERNGALPSGYGILEEEWGPDGYPSIEVLDVRGTPTTIHLEDSVWCPRAERWAWGLFVMRAIGYESVMLEEE